ncbi:MAG: transcriptional regulator [Verrucomicrobia bacterium]|nr:transcriptional regulator [Cytophagales bacterium]
MKHKNISAQSATLLQYFLQQDQACFSIEEARRVFSQSEGGAVKELLSDMTRRGLLLRLKEGLYCIIPYEKDPDTYFPDWHLVAGYLVGGASHYIGYYSALQLHSLITQPALREQVVVNRQFKPTLLTVRNVSFQFIYHNPQHFFGAKSVWMDAYNKVMCSDVEKTLVDCLFKPDYGGGITEIAKALFKAKEKVDYEKLLTYAIQFDSQAVIKRLGFLLELLEIQTPITEELHKLRTAATVSLEPSYPAEGKILSRWSIRRNMDVETITEALYT